ncbi:hypothetical protein AAA799E16_01725 [Marine Group I thaumarchaeote SCGC AAA799-E16]|uniref:Blue copper domain-containing protein n=4 Tax=Marine Group I TaxID=905826 RepID=A0A081RNY0_9ARCH|nr:hypothetical protein AAA799N04_00573 [Marine Group I thaumarchaeote SCGC AAA799-N04]KER05623.1 hypothetical protein AAA799E16_01725 [Marine Group I thaumarchaeote SCGC AAA799-E16]KFM15674.1 hypothetical protein AAA799D11_01116 [Marine Group I thaumarchaeote SCGC AAA799-D11]KFM16801.1 hypothetical protein SCCGRSA3_02050 [Marine Group I thaumarchaeote SCGC RSA3]
MKAGKKMKITTVIIATVLALSLAVFPSAHAEPTVEIIMEKTTYSYCEKLFYTIKVSEVTGNPAIIHIRDETGKGSSAIPIPIADLENPVPSRVAFEKEIFPLGKYFIDVEYSGVEATAEFTLIDTDKVCIPETVKPIMANWLSGNISDGFLIDAFQKFTEGLDLFKIPFDINETTVYDVQIPEWVKNVGYWWLEGAISDDELVNAINNLVERNIISLEQKTGNEI